MLLVAQTVNHAPSLVLIEAKKGGNGGCVLPRTFYLKNADGSDTADAKELLEKGTIYGK
jgi:tRNA1(Val) A37 N6-methylase TrmN6